MLRAANAKVGNTTARSAKRGTLSVKMGNAHVTRYERSQPMSLKDVAPARLQVKGTLCFKSFTLLIDWGEERLCLPIMEEESGYFNLQFYPPSTQEENMLTREILKKVDWSRKETQKVVAYVATEKGTDITKIKLPKKLSNFDLRSLGCTKPWAMPTKTKLRRW